MNTIPLRSSPFLSNDTKHKVVLKGKYPPPTKFLENLTHFMSNDRHVQTKKCPDGPGKDEFALIKEKQ